VVWAADADVQEVEGEFLAEPLETVECSEPVEAPVAAEPMQAPGTAESLQASGTAEPAPAAVAAQPKWRRWRMQGRALIDYLLDSEVHTFAFSVAANAILSFVPFVVLLYQIAHSVFHSDRTPTHTDIMVTVIDQMVDSYLPMAAQAHAWLDKNFYYVAEISSRHGIQALSLVMILISCTGIFLPLEVALNQAWGVHKSRNYLKNQALAFGLAIVMVVLGMASIFANTGLQKGLAVIFFHHTQNFVFNAISGLWLALTTGVVSILFFFSIYWVLPNCRVPWRPVLRTSIVTGLIWLGAKYVFVLVLPHLELAKLYGAFSISVGLLLWAYVSGLILFAGAQFSVARVGRNH
jgi:membrane protein